MPPCPAPDTKRTYRPTRDGHVSFQVLGPVEAFRDGRVLPLGGKLSRALLATLLLHAGHVRTVEQLIDDLWHDVVPRSTRSSLHNLVSGLRRVLGTEFLVQHRSGYVLAVRDDQLDAFHFERLLRRSGGEDAPERVRTLENALALWRGPPLLDVTYEEFAQGEIRRLEELHTWALQELLAAKLEFGAREAVVPELQKLLVRFPFRERLRMLLMVALHGSGRSVEALAAYGEWRRLLAESWDVEPGPAIQKLAADVRAHSPVSAVSLRR